MRSRPRFGLLLFLVTAGCTSAPATTTPTVAVTPAPTTAPTLAPTATLPPTATPDSTATPGPTAAPTVTAAPTPAVTQAPAIAIEDGVVTINPDALAPLFYAPANPSASDPFYHFHTTPAVDGFFLSVEAYTDYGPDWTGQFGTFPIDCTQGGTGICVHFDPDGPGSQTDLGADFQVSGDVTFTRLDNDGYDIILTDVHFSDGTTIPGPLQLTSA